ncbi:hypothetical protein V6V47_14800 [Micromonospora sp. CPCC 205539]|uniref:hypothetical protein n=1 Tax=Micromonospora sp. CPCC 205539 TaxID=3122408 RepID=UPI002FF0008A
MTPSMHTPVHTGQRGWTPWGIVAACVAAVLAMAFLPVLGFLVWMYGGPDIDEPRAATDQFVQHLERIEDDAAYRSMCSDVRDRITIVQFTEAVERMGRPVSHEVGKGGFSNEPGTAASVTVRVTGSSGATTSLSLRLEDETHAGWRVCDRAFG